MPIWTAILVTDSRFHFHVTEHFSRFENCLPNVRSQTFFILIGKRVILTLFFNIVDHITLGMWVNHYVEMFS